MNEEEVPVLIAGGGGAGGENGNWREASPWHQLNLPQIRLEPILKAGAERLSPDRIRFNHELLELAQDDDGVTALVGDNRSGEPYSVRCDYLLGADGGRRVAGLIDGDAAAKKTEKFKSFQQLMK